MIFAALAAVLAAAAPPAPAAAPQSPPPDQPAAVGSNTVAPVTVEAMPSPNAPPAATVNVNSDDTAMGRWASIWPAGAWNERLNGHVILSCDIDRYGLAEWCKVASEVPEGKGFGAAALELRPTFKVKPAMGPDGPIDALMNIAVEFKRPDYNTNSGSMGSGGSTEGGMSGRGGGGVSTGFGGPPLERHAVSILNNPIWDRTVSYDDMARAYPSRGRGADGYAVAHCEVTRKGSLSGCQIIKEDPDNRGFGEAALRLATRFKVDPAWTSAPNHADIWVDVPFRFPAPGASDDRTLDSPYWVSGFDPAQELKLFPPEAAAQGVTTGTGTVKCVVAADGSLTDCAPQEADPEGLGFSEAAVKLVSTLRMNPWTADGRPVDGGTVRVRVRLNLKPES